MDPVVIKELIKALAKESYQVDLGPLDVNVDLSQESKNIETQLEKISDWLEEIDKTLATGLDRIADAINNHE